VLVGNCDRDRPPSSICSSGRIGYDGGPERPSTRPSVRARHRALVSSLEAAFRFGHCQMGHLIERQATWALHAWPDSSASSRTNRSLDNASPRPDAADQSQCLLRLPPDRGNSLWTLRACALSVSPLPFHAGSRHTCANQKKTRCEPNFGSSRQLLRLVGGQNAYQTLEDRRNRYGWTLALGTPRLGITFCVQL
jgi:hypothetical protein